MGFDESADSRGQTPAEHSAGSPPPTPTAGPSPTRTATPTPTPTSPCEAFQPVTSPNGGIGTSTLYAVAAVSATDVWAVGSAARGYAYNPAAIVEHWDGTAWQVMYLASPEYSIFYGVAAVRADDVWAVGVGNGAPLAAHWDGHAWRDFAIPPVGTLLADLVGVSGAAPDDVWAVGRYYASDTTYQPLVMHWDGKTWTPFPRADSAPGMLDSVTAIAGDDVWAVGYSAGTALTQHWNGHAWSTVPNPVGDGALLSVAAAGSNDVWAVGERSARTLTIHWDGVAWTIVPAPDVDAQDEELTAVAVVAADDAWALGIALDGLGRPASALVAHWDGSTWTVLPTPDGPPTALYGVAAVSASGVWAVGDLRYAYLGGRLTRTWTAHWDGAAWSVVPSPTGASSSSGLRAVAVLSRRDAWAVGNSGDRAAGWPWTLTEHWDGTAWQVVPSVDVGPMGNTLQGIAALAPDDVWAVGFAGAVGYEDTLTEHWDGTAWSVVPSPNGAGPDNALEAVSAVAADDVWAVGSGSPSAGGAPQALIEHWNGRAWSVVPSPSLGASQSGLHGVAAIGAADVWAVGNADGVTLVEHWAGAAWSVVPSPSRGTSADSLLAVTAGGPADVWAVGVGALQTLTEHWDGTAWSIVPSPNIGGDENRLTGVAAESTGAVWAAGYYGNTGDGTLVERWDGTAWRVVPSSNPSSSSNFLYGVAARAGSPAVAVGAASWRDALVERDVVCAVAFTPTPTPTGPALRAPVPAPPARAP